MAKMTREHFKAAAEEIKFNNEFQTFEEKMKLVRVFVSFFKSNNPGFDEARFVKACGLETSPKRKG